MVTHVELRILSRHLTIDETWYSYRGMIGIKMDNKSKPARYGLLFISLCDAEVTYTYFRLPYVGRTERLPDQFYVPKTDEKSKYLVGNV